jgi:hypothetical protein
LLHPTASTAAPFFLSSDSHTAVPTDPQLLPAPRKHFLLLLSAAVRLHQQLPATPGETHTCSSSSQLPSHFSSASGASPPFQQILFSFGLLHSHRMVPTSHLAVSFNQRPQTSSSMVQRPAT